MSDIEIIDNFLDPSVFEELKIKMYSQQMFWPYSAVLMNDGSAEITCDDLECETFEVKYDLSEGDTFELEVLDGEIRPTVILPDETSDFDNNQNEYWEYTAESDGVHTFQIAVVEESSIDYSISRGIIIDYGLYLVGVLVLAFGILKRITKDVEEEAVEALLED